ncbi:MAG: three-Cys-motif partner protein TcmP [Deltaproteobacteria bacterium]
MSKSFTCIDNNCPSKDNDDYNCAHASGGDGGVVQCVDKWANDKFSYFDRYLGATRKARAKYVKNGNAVYIDLFSGPGQCRIKNIQEEIPGGALRASKLQEAPFNRIILNDLSANNVKAIKQRIKNAEVQNGDANTVVDAIVKDLLSAQYDKLHFVFLDPFSPANLKFQTIKSLASLKRVDIMINFPIGPIRRNYKTWLKKDGTILDEFLGTADWRQAVQGVSESAFCNNMIDIYYSQLKKIGFPEEGLGIIDEKGNSYLGANIAAVRNSKNVLLYYLILASKHKLAANIWQSILKTDPSGQKYFF